MATGKRLRLKDFVRYVRENGRWAQAVYGEIEEVQFQFNELYSNELTRWQEQIGTCITMILQDHDRLDEDLAELVRRGGEQSRTELEEEIASLGRQVAERRASADDLLARAQAELAELRTANPTLDDQEEKAKAKLVSLADQIVALSDQTEQLSRGTFGALKNGRKLRELRNRRKALLAAQEKANVRLAEVRSKWQAQKKGAEEEQTRLRQEWQESTVTAAQAQARHDYLSENIEELSLRKGIERTLVEMETSPVNEGPLGEALQAMTDLNSTKSAYEKGLTSVAEMLGLLKGLREGLERFQQSVDKVLEEQERYNLAKLVVGLSPAVIEFNRAWKDLRELVKDEKYLGKHPLEFSKRVDAFRRTRFTDEGVQTMFEDMGSALSRATKKWD